MIVLPTLSGMKHQVQLLRLYPNIFEWSIFHSHLFASPFRPNARRIFFRQRPVMSWRRSLDGTDGCDCMYTYCILCNIHTCIYIYTYNTYLYILLSIMDTYIDCSDCLYLFIGFKYLAQVSLVLGRHRR